MKAEKGKIVSVEYEGRFETGEVFDTNKHDGHSHPLEFEVGAGMVVKGFDNAVEGMEKGEEKEFTIKPEEAYGERQDNLTQKIPRNILPSDQEPKPGMMLIASAPDGQQMPVKITDVDEETITVDMNHPLAGKTLVFNIKILDVKDKSDEESLPEVEEKNEDSLEDIAE